MLYISQQGYAIYHVRLNKTGPGVIPAIKCISKTLIVLQNVFSEPADGFRKIIVGGGEAQAQMAFPVLSEI
ncbi:MAG TPA: hypothetical protein DIT24_03985 [Synergistaceae bacterium]|nr:hypothetical protein [Synergistaceae bacterium]